MWQTPYIIIAKIGMSIQGTESEGGGGTAVYAYAQWSGEC